MRRDDGRGGSFQVDVASGPSVGGRFCRLAPAVPRAESACAVGRPGEPEGKAGFFSSLARCQNSPQPPGPGLGGDGGADRSTAIWQAGDGRRGSIEHATGGGGHKTDAHGQHACFQGAARLQADGQADGQAPQRPRA